MKFINKFLNLKENGDFFIYKKDVVIRDSVGFRLVPHEPLFTDSHLQYFNINSTIISLDARCEYSDEIADRLGGEREISEYAFGYDIDQTGNTLDNLVYFDDKTVVYFPYYPQICFKHIRNINRYAICHRNLIATNVFKDNYDEDEFLCAINIDDKLFKTLKNYFLSLKI